MLLALYGTQLPPPGVWWWLWQDQPISWLVKPGPVNLDMISSSAKGTSILPQPTPERQCDWSRVPRGAQGERAAAGKNTGLLCYGGARGWGRTVWDPQLIQYQE